MEFRKYEMLSDYLLTEKGSVVHVESGEQIQLEPQKNYKILTDEIHKLENGKEIRLWRRFTKEQVIKMFNNGEVYDDTKITIAPIVEPGDEPAIPAEPVTKTADQVAASKHVVKSNPKTPKALKVKAEKAIKETKLPEGIKNYPYLLINGVAYQSSRKASEAIGGSYSTIMRKAKENKEGWFYIETEGDEKA